MKIKINHIAKIEGHAGFVGNILNGDVKSAKIEIKSSARLIEGLLIGRHYLDAPIITARICGICPVIHNLTSIKALENALDIRPSADTLRLRKLMLMGQVIHSHGLHTYFLSLPDFFDIENDLNFVQKTPAQAQLALAVREFGVNLVKIIGGRTVHPIRSVIGGFKVAPTKQEIGDLSIQAKDVLPQAIELANFFKSIKYPKFKRKTEYICLKNKNEYAIYDGHMTSTEGLNIPVKKFAHNIKEIQKPYETVKRANWDNNWYMVGALARLNNNFLQLNKQAKNIWQSTGIEMPDYNSFHNILAQAVEMVHAIEEAIKLLLKMQVKSIQADIKPYQVKASQGGAAAEAPRGTLYHYYELTKDGHISNCNIITPTAQFIGNLEEDIAHFIPNLKKLSKTEKKKKIRMLIRAYDPCVSCATH